MTDIYSGNWVKQTNFREWDTRRLTVFFFIFLWIKVQLLIPGNTNFQEALPAPITCLRGDYLILWQ